MSRKMGVNETDSMKNMMEMSVYFAIADVLDIDAMELDAGKDLAKEIHPSETVKQQLKESVMELFEGCELDFSRIHNVQDIVDQVIYQESPVIH